MEDVSELSMELHVSIAQSGNDVRERTNSASLVIASTNELLEDTNESEFNFQTEMGSGQETILCTSGQVVRACTSPCIPRTPLTPRSLTWS